MVTFPQLIAALWFGALAWFSAGLVVPLLPEGLALGYYFHVNALIGVIMGWRFMGRRAFDRLSQQTGYGITTSFLIVFWALLAFGGYEMYRRSIRMRYDGPVEALVGMVEHMKDYAILIATPTVMGALIVGGAIGGLVVWYTGQRTT
ncbi:MAG: TrgA family protein [Paracoccaceae bacterium]